MEICFKSQSIWFLPLVLLHINILTLGGLFNFLEPTGSGNTCFPGLLGSSQEYACERVWKTEMVYACVLPSLPCEHGVLECSGEESPELGVNLEFFCALD